MHNYRSFVNGVVDFFDGGGSISYKIKADFEDIALKSINEPYIQYISYATCKSPLGEKTFKLSHLLESSDEAREIIDDYVQFFQKKFSEKKLKTMTDQKSDLERTILISPIRQP